MVTVLEKWNTDISDMVENVKECQLSVDKYGEDFRKDVETLKKKAAMQQKSSEKYWAKFNDEIKTLRTKADAYKTRFMEAVGDMQKAVKGMILHIWGAYAPVP